MNWQDFNVAVETEVISGLGSKNVDDSWRFVSPASVMDKCSAFCSNLRKTCDTRKKRLSMLIKEAEHLWQEWLAHRLCSFVGKVVVLKLSSVLCYSTDSFFLDSLDQETSLTVREATTTNLLDNFPRPSSKWMKNYCLMCQALENYCQEALKHVEGG